LAPVCSVGGGHADFRQPGSVMESDVRVPRLITITCFG
jgi:hypothetical protein